MTTPLCIHTARLDLYRYNKIDWIVVFEGFIIYSQLFGNRFYRRRENVLEDLRITRTIYENRTGELISDGYLSKYRADKQMTFKNVYQVNFDKIIGNLDQIYKFEILNNENQKYVRERYVQKFNHFKRNAESNPENLPYTMIKKR